MFAVRIRPTAIHVRTVFHYLLPLYNKLLFVIHLSAHSFCFHSLFVWGGASVCHRYPLITTAAHLSCRTVWDARRCDACFATALIYMISIFYLPLLRMWYGYHKSHQNCLHWSQPPEHDAHAANTGYNSSQHPSAVNRNLHNFYFLTF